MTVEQWRLICPGDVLVDNAAGKALRKVFEVRRIRGMRGQGASVRTTLVVSNLKSNGATTIIFASDVGGPLRFDFPERAE